jgi:hypothetical protein
MLEKAEGNSKDRCFFILRMNGSQWINTYATIVGEFSISIDKKVHT